MFTDRKIFVKNTLKILLPYEEVQGHLRDIKGRELYVPKGEKEAYKKLAGDMEIKTFNPEAVENYANLVVDGNYLKGKENIEIENYGALEFTERITEEEIAKGIKSIKNYGKIQCPKEIYGILSQKVAENYGILNREQENSEKGEDSGYTIVANIGALEL
ncbi:hypothetical protein [Isachenkonia alkalipeptolytica]|uniref:Uncharacterized protein n=1 Tax=Isachenkonia alkalipeptolytica TaxID=2565777 RepID=A0AA43XMG6_9CLOT|nr:hypothetical protein [Isachenkonia alkalipeptolytica]NBG89417.1 hypothetical protein [Isachenkonia alkalipeptolytica]